MFSKVFQWFRDIYAAFIMFWVDMILLVMVKAMHHAVVAKGLRQSLETEAATLEEQIKELPDDADEMGKACGKINNIERVYRGEEWAKEQLNYMCKEYDLRLTEDEKLAIMEDLNYGASDPELDKQILINVLLKHIDYIPLRFQKEFKIFRYGDGISQKDWINYFQYDKMPEALIQKSKKKKSITKSKFKSIKSKVKKASKRK